MKKQYALMCGVGRGDITPPVGTVLYGYAPGRPSLSVGDNLTATAIMLKSEDCSALMVTCTLCALNMELTQRLQKAAGKIAGVPAENVLISATHTHSGPNTSYNSAWGNEDTQYIETILFPGVLKAAREAVQSLRPAQMGIGETYSDVGINRRELKETGAIALGQNPWGPADHTMTVVAFRGEDGAVIANMIHYCCHCTASGKNPEITRDWAGVMTDMLETETGAITGFYAGVEGDQGPNLPNGHTIGTYALALQLGARAGVDAVRAFRNIKQWQDEPVRVIHGTVKIPFLPLPSREEAEKNLAELGSLEQLRADAQHIRVNEYLRWQNVLAEHTSGQPLKTHWTFSQSIVTVGPLAILPSPFEAFVELGLRIRKGSPYPYTLSLCNTGGSMAYLPTLGELARGGYEIRQFLSAFWSTYAMPNNSDDYWVQQNLKLLREE